MAVAAVTADLNASIDEVARMFGTADGRQLTALSDPWFDLLAEAHAHREDRLFAS